MEKLVLYVVKWMEDTYYFSTYEKAVEFLKKESFITYTKENEEKWLKSMIREETLTVY
jgi:hypothetical protein